MVCKILVARSPTYIALVEFLFTCSNVNKQHLCYNKIQTQAWFMSWTRVFKNLLNFTFSDLDYLPESYLLKSQILYSK